MPSLLKAPDMTIMPAKIRNRHTDNDYAKACTILECFVSLSPRPLLHVHPKLTMHDQTKPDNRGSHCGIMCGRNMYS